MSRENPRLDRGAYEFFDLQPTSGDVVSEILAGLTSTPKRISPKFFYDEVGSKLFEDITRLQEYYPTRTEMALFDAHLPEVAAQIGAGVCLIEYGSGSSLKIRKVLQSLTPRAYVPVDISADHLQDNARRLHADFPELEVFPVCADFTQPFTLPARVAHYNKVGFFPGSSIGNFEPEAALGFLQTVRESVGDGGLLLIGVDRKKPRDILERAYDDAQGVTAAFNRNALININRITGANFDPHTFGHIAHYNDTLGCIQMFLEARQAQRVEVAGQVIQLTAGERIHTENSFKYTPDEFLQLSERAGFAQAGFWSDANAWFSLFLMRAI
ncbi:MAG: L-histidine N(alpha)-methyltransferase [Pseudomonadota bacterium]